jgi:GT2 family glycosyltransferase
MKQIHFNTIFADKNLGAYYNRCCKMVDDPETWIGLWDSDVMMFNTFIDWGAFLEKIVAKHSGIDLFGCITNRIGTHKQRYTKYQEENRDIVYHRNLAEKIFAENYTTINDQVGSLSGFFLFFKKKTWDKCGPFPEDTKFVGVDTAFSKSVIAKGGRIGVIRGMYVFHYYRLAEGSAFTNHLK